jgi:hypothetical protein
MPKIAVYNQHFENKVSALYLVLALGLVAVLLVYSWS